jgi:hypothetical protein
MLRSPLMTAAVLTATLAIVGVAFAGSRRYVWDAKTNSYTGVSGAVNSGVSTIELTNDDNGVRSISITEKADHPCLIKVQPHPLPDAPSKPGVLQSNQLRSLCDGQEKSVSVGAGNYATAIQVCTTGAKDSEDRRIKGIRLWGASVGADGKLTHNEAPAEFELPNCAIWSAKSACGHGEIVTGIRGIYRKEGTSYFSGISLRCAALTESTEHTRPK